MNEKMSNVQAPQVAVPPMKQPIPSAPKPPEKPGKRLVFKPATPVLRFSPTAWAKLLYFRDRQDAEVTRAGTQ